VIRELFEGLTRIGRDDQPKLAMAESVSVSEDGTTYTFKLRPAKWSNGLDITADDFVYAWKCMVSPEFSTPFAYAFYLVKNGKKVHSKECSIEEFGVKALDAKTLQVTLEHPAPYFLEFLANPLFSPVCRAVVEKKADWATGTFPSYVSNGPFILKDRRLKSHILLEKNPLYWNPDQAASDQISFAIIEDPQTAYNMFQSGALDWYGDPCGNMSLEMISDLKEKKELITKQTGGSFWLSCNVNAPHLASTKVRKALACAINRADICDKLLQGGEVPAYSFVPKHLSLLEEKSFEDNSQDQARALFAEGIADLGYTKDTYPPIVISHWADPTIKAIMGVIQQQIQNTLHVKVELVALDWSSFMRKVLSSGDYQIAGVAWFTWYSDPIYNLGHLKYRNNGINGTGWEDPVYVRYLDLADASTDVLQRRAYLRQAEMYVMSQLPIIPVFYQTYKYVKVPGVTGEYVTPVGQMELKWLKKTTP
jgi:oligopeptide transport system substrate-binding protein